MVKQQNYQPLFAKRTKKMRSSIIRELLKIPADVLSLGGGMPASESFPHKLIMQLAKSAYRKYGPLIFQYGPTEGITPLRQAAVKLLQKIGVKVATANEILVSTGSQQFLDLLGKILIDEGDIIAIESPSYLGALQAFDVYGPKYVHVPTDDQGIVPKELEKIIKTKNIKFIYCIPTFQNPSGRTTSLTRRKQMAKLLKQYNLLLVEDDPYCLVRFSGKKIPPIQAFAPDHVIYLTSFSKILAPGFRLGLCKAPIDIENMLVQAKQGADLHSSTFNQAIAALYIEENHLQKQLPLIIKLYRQRKTAMIAAIKKYFPADCHFTNPDGGLFIWVKLAGNIDTEKLLPYTIARKVAFVPGSPFYADKNLGKNEMRLNFSNQSPQNIAKAIKIIGECIKITTNKPISNKPMTNIYQ